MSSLPAAVFHPGHISMCSISIRVSSWQISCPEDLRSLATRVSDLIGTVLALDLHGEGLGPCGSQPDDLIGSRALCVSASFVLTVWLSGQPAQQF